MPAEQPWIPLVEALGWARFRYARPLELLAAEASKQLQMPREICLHELQAMWPELADRGTVNELVIRGVPRGSPGERGLTIDEMRQCRHLGWLGREKDEAVVERYGPSYAEQWDQLDDEAGLDFTRVVVARDGLLRAYPPVSEEVHRRRASARTARSALDWLKGRLREGPPRSTTKSDLVQSMVREFGISVSQAKSNWAEAVKEHPAWTMPGRPPKKSVRKIEPEKES